MTFADLTNAQLSRLYLRCWERMTRGDGYQRYGYDWPTLHLTRPSWMRHIEPMRAEITRRIEIIP
jgi:hypothetical protein